MSRMNFVLILSSVLLVFNAANSRSSQCTDMSEAQPARLIIGENHKQKIARLMPKWRTDASSRFVHFGGYVGLDGKLNRVSGIYSSIAMNGSARDRLVNRLQWLDFTPAIDRGEKLRVFVSFTLIGTNKDGVIRTSLLLNHLSQHEKYGANYLAPQRISSGASWWTGGTRIEGAIWGELSVDISQEGYPGNAQITRWATGSKRMKTRFLRKIVMQCFIPGSFQGESVALPYVEVFQHG